jgi:hypothetical protein
MTDEQKEAVEWLRCASLPVQWGETDNPEDKQHRAIILAMLAEPRLPRPEDVPLKVLRAMSAEHAISDDNWVEVMRAAYRALYDHYTAPRSKQVEVWHVEYCNGSVPRVDDPYISRMDAERGADAHRRSGHQCIRVTGPHEQEVPADDAR